MDGSPMHIGKFHFKFLFCFSDDLPNERCSIWGCCPRLVLRHVGEMFMLRSNQTPPTNLLKAHLAKKKSLVVANLHCTQFFEVLPKENKSVCWQSFSCDSKWQMVAGLRDGQMISNGLCPDAITMFTPTHRINRHLASASASKSANFDSASTFTTEGES